MRFQVHSFKFLSLTVLLAMWSDPASIRMVLAQDPAAVALPPAAQREISRRMERVEQARDTMVSGDRLRKKEDYESAIREYQTAMDILPEGEMTESLRGEITGKFADASVGLAQQRIEEGRFDEAIALVEQVLSPSVSPEHMGAKTLLKRLNDPKFYNRSLTPEHAARVRQVEEALRLAEGYFALGDFNKAEEEYHRVLNIDRYNTGARRGLEENAIEKRKYFDSAYDETRARFMRELMEQWETPVPRIGLDSLMKDQREQGRISGDGVAYISTKLKEIIIPVISFRDSPLVDAVEFLRQKSVELDKFEENPAKKGVNIVIQGSPGGEAGDGGSDRITLNLTNVPLVEALRYITELAGRKYKIDPFAVKIVPITDVGEDLFTNVFSVPPNFLNLAGGGEGGGGGNDDPFATTTDSGPELTARPTAKAVLEEKGIEFPPGSSAFFNPTTSQLVVRNTQNNMELIETFVDSLKEDVQKQIYITSKFVEIAQTNLYELGFDWLIGAFSIGSDGILGSGGTVGTGSPVTIADWPIANPATIQVPNPAPPPLFNQVPNPDRTGHYPVTAGNRSGETAVTSNSIDALIATSGEITPGLSTPRRGPGILTLAGILTEPQFQMVIRGIDQKKGVDLLSAPSVTARSGQRAKIEVIREFIYPTEYDPPEIPDRAGGDVVFLGVGNNQANTVPVTPANPTAFETRNTGVTLEVDPVIGADGYTIDLNLVPEVVEFQGFINYGSPIRAPTGVPGGLGNLITANRILMPVFGTRKVTTAVTIWDGQTVVIGGLIREDVENVEDKVPIIGDAPIIGRLFRSKVNQRQKRNLTVFVTAKLIDPAGQPIRKFETEIEDYPEEEVIEANPLLPPPDGSVSAYLPPQWGQ